MKPICGPLVNDCVFSLNSKCVIYDGPNTVNIGYTQNMSLTDLLLLIDSKFSGILTGIFFADTSTVDFQGTGTSGNPYTATVNISATAGNIITSMSDGLYANTVITPDTLQSVTNNGNTTDNVIVINGENNVVGLGEGLYLRHTLGVGSRISSGDPAVHNHGEISFDDSFVTLASNPNILGVGKTLSLASFGTGSGIDISSDDITMTALTFNFISSGLPAVFNMRVKGDNAIDPDEFVTLSQLTSAPIPTLQQVTTAGNITTENMSIVPAASVNGDFNITTSGPVGARIFLTHNTVNIARILARSTDTTVQLINGTAARIILDGGTASDLNLNGNGLILFGTSSTIQAASPGLIFTNSATVETNRILSTGRMTGTPAVNPNEFTTLSQLTAVAVEIDNVSIASTAVTQTYMNTNYSSTLVGNTIWFTNLSDDATKVLIVNKIGATTWSANADTKLI